MTDRKREESSLTMNPLGTADPVQLGPYRLHSLLGTGTTGPVYFGRDDSGGTAAVKLIRAELAEDRAFAEHVVSGALAARPVLATGVARVLETGTEGEQPWVAAEFVAGPTLEQAVRSYGPLPEPAVRTLAGALARTLDDIHAAGLLHHDLKPAGVVLTSEGPRIVGFGTARPGRRLALTATDSLPVAAGYGAPEQILGQLTGPAADVFALGAVLAYAASGSPAFPGDHAPAVLHETVNGEPRLDDVPAELRILVTRCLAKDPHARPSLADVEAAAVPMPLEASPAPSPEPSPTTTETSWLPAPLAAYVTRREHTDHTAGDPSVGAVPNSGTERPTWSRRKLLATLAAGAGVTAVAGTGGWWLLDRHREQAAFALPPAAKTPTARRRPKPEDSNGLEGQKITPLWGPSRLISADPIAPLLVRDVIVLGAKDGGIAAHSVVDGKRRWTAPGADRGANYLSLSDSLVAAADDNGTLRTYVAATGEPRWTAKADVATLLAADEDAVYVVTDQGRLRSIGRSDARIRWTVRVSGELRTERPPLGVAANGRLLVATASGDVFAVHTADGRKAWRLDGQSIAEETIRPAVADGTVYLNGHSLTARRLEDGKELWNAQVGPSTRTKDLRIWGKPTIHKNAVYATHGVDASALDLRDGTQVWNDRRPGSAGSPLIAQGRGIWSYSADDFSGEDRLGLVQAVDPSAFNTPVWEFDLKHKGKHWLMAGGNRVFVVDGPMLTALPVF
ncbi:serine/threonine-protein kinase [Streptomyces boluensis]|uniref:PQQ-binding-like beta-propeller repeat protein n=1 Tax=Streptomyces boluensis TaxID=1775135 RepID=A0A964V0G2_9ACTN|nr:serine/threonine-protein kinase [Streptomyces boluensis]NBE54855.1 PQQ-binding-like beta-propeller repeat protein [Streptomyces boluensis]